MARTRSSGTSAAFRNVEEAASKRKKARLSPFEAYASRPGFDWTDVSPATVVDGLHHALTRGAAVTVSLTGDGGAVKLTVWLDNNKHYGYAGDAETLNALFEALSEVEDPEDD